MHSIEPKNYDLREACLLIVISDKHQVKNNPNTSGGRGKRERLEAVCNFFFSANNINPCTVCFICGLLIIKMQLP